VKPRLQPLRCPDRPGYLTVQLPRGPHSFRLPTRSEARRLAEYLHARPGWTERTVEVKGRAITGSLPSDSLDAEYGALLVGVAWHHEAFELESVYPLDDPTVPAILRYAQAVERELEEAGYRGSEVDRLAGALSDAMVERERADHRATLEAAKLADFSSPPPAVESSP
jgi:hypothetical protein